MNESNISQSSISYLRLKNFRSHVDFCSDINSKYVLISGKNGSGKTSLMEAVSMLSVGSGMLSSNFSDITSINEKRNNENYDKNAYTSVENALASTISSGEWLTQMSIDTEGGERHSIGSLYRQNKKVMYLDGKIQRSASALAPFLRPIWFTPRIGRLFTDTASEKRKFLDRLVYNIISEHARDVIKCNYYTKSRLKLLRDGESDKSWITSIEQSMAELFVRITINRVTVCEAMNEILFASKLGVKCSISIDCAVEKIIELPKHKLKHTLEHKSLGQFFQSTVACALKKKLSYSDSCKDKIMTKLRLSRTMDQQLQQTTFGTHKSKFIVFNEDKGLDTSFCSTGEQKCMLIDIILAQAQLVSCDTEALCLMLLDDVLEHLDKERQEGLFIATSQLPIDVWITSTNAANSQTLMPRDYMEIALKSF